MGERWCMGWLRRHLILVSALTIAAPAVAQEAVSIEQIRITGRAASVDTAMRGRVQETEYLLSGTAASGLLSTAAPSVVAPSANQARTVQIGLGNSASVDMSGTMNAALQAVTGNLNTVNQAQSGGGNTSNVTVFGDSNTIGTRQNGIAASATITVRGDANTIAVQQQGIAPVPVSVTQVGNGGNVSVSQIGNASVSRR